MHQFIITQNEESYRLDNFLIKIAPSLSYIAVQKLLRLKKVKINKKKQTADYRLQIGDIVEVHHDLPIKNSDKNQLSQISQEKLLQRFESCIEFENDDFIIFNKPAGLAVQGGSGISMSVDTMLQNISDHYRLVHRIDKETSGILIIAKNLRASRIFTELFKNGEIYKEYIAINKGKIQPSSGMIEKPINQNDESLPAITEYEILEYLSENLTLTKFMPQTGRKHQLRIHSTLIDHPILGDKKYDKSYDKNIKNLFLHAYKIEFYFDKKKYEFSINLPEHFNKYAK